MIAEGRVQVNGQTIRQQGVTVNPSNDEVTIDGRRLVWHAEAVPKTILLNKPAGYLCSMYDPQQRPLVKDLYAKNIEGRLFPVGRLDFETSGLLLCTNDGTLANQLMHPRYKFEKEYLVTVAGNFAEPEIAALRRGVELEDGPARPLKVIPVSHNFRRSQLSMVICEGRNRQVRRMLQAIGFKVTSLQRTRLAFLGLQGVREGSWRWLTQLECLKLQSMAEGES